MKITAVVATLISAVILSGCNPLVPTEKISSEQKSFTILAIDPPKHVYVDLKDENGQEYKHVYVSKHCNKWRTIVIGSKINLEVAQYKKGEETWSKIIARPVCPGK